MSPFLILNPSQTGLGMVINKPFPTFITLALNSSTTRMAGNRELLYSIIPLSVALVLAGVFFATQPMTAQFYAPIFGGLVGAATTYYFIQVKDIAKENRLNKSVKQSIRSELDWYNKTLQYFMDNCEPTTITNLRECTINSPHFQKFRLMAHNKPRIYESIDFNTKLQTLNADTIIMLNDVYQEIHQRFDTCIYIADPILQVNMNNSVELQKILEKAMTTL